MVMLERRKCIEVMPSSEKKTTLLRSFIADIESNILEILNKSYNFAHSLNESFPQLAQLILLLDMRCWALNTMFYDHCNDSEIVRFIMINEHLYDATQHMYERAKMVQDLMLAMSVHQEDDDIWIESNLKFWKEDAVCSLEDDSYYMSDFSRFIPLLSSIDSNLLHRSAIEQVYCPAKIHEGKLESKDKIKNNLDDGVSWSEGYLKHPKFSNIIICHAVHDICDHKNYSIPDLLRMKSFEVCVELKIQSFHDLHMDGCSSN